MSDELEKLMREALRRQSAPPGFSERVLARLPEHQGKRRGLQKSWWISGALAASVTAALTLHQLHTRTAEREGLRARAQLMEALRVTSEKLDMAYQAVQTPVEAKATGGAS